MIFDSIFLPYENFSTYDHYEVLQKCIPLGQKKLIICFSGTFFRK